MSPKVLVIRTLNGVEYKDKNFFGYITKKKVDDYKNQKIKKRNYRELFVSKEKLKPVLEFESYSDLLIERKNHLPQCKRRNIEDEESSQLSLINEEIDPRVSFVEDKENPFQQNDNFDFDYHPEYQRATINITSTSMLEFFKSFK